MKALLLVDIQRDFCPGGRLAVKDGHLVVPVANSLMRSGIFDVVLASQDWHPPGHVSFASSHPGKNPFEVITIDGIDQMLWPDHCLQNSPGAALHPDLLKEHITRVIQKGTHRDIDSYSAFFDNRHRHETPLRHVLAEEAAARGLHGPGAIDLYVAGLATDVCVAATARDARRLGLPVTLVLDGCRGVSPDSEVSVLRELAQAGVTIIESRDLILPGGRSRDLTADGRSPGRNLTQPRSSGFGPI